MVCAAAATAPPPALRGSAKRGFNRVERGRAHGIHETMAADPPIEKRQLVTGHSLLGQLRPHEMERLMIFARRQRYDANERIFDKGDPGHAMMTVVSGRVKISVSSPDGKETVLAVLGTGEVLGEMAVLENTERSADATALEASELLVVQRRDFIPFLERNPEISIRLLQVLSARLRRTSEIVEDRAFLNLPARLAKMLIDLAEEDGRETPDGVRVDLNMSQKTLAALLGASRESLNKQLSAWQADGLIGMGRGYVVLSRPDELARILAAGQLGLSH